MGRAHEEIHHLRDLDPVPRLPVRDLVAVVVDVVDNRRVVRADDEDDCFGTEQRHLFARPLIPVAKVVAPQTARRLVVDVGLDDARHSDAARRARGRAGRRANRPRPRASTDWRGRGLRDGTASAADCGAVVPPAICAPLASVPEPAAWASGSFELAAHAPAAAAPAIASTMTATAMRVRRLRRATSRARRLCASGSDVLEGMFRVIADPRRS